MKNIPYILVLILTLGIFVCSNINIVDATTEKRVPNRISTDCIGDKTGMTDCLPEVNCIGNSETNCLIVKEETLLERIIKNISEIFNRFLRYIVIVL